MASKEEVKSLLESCVDEYTTKAITDQKFGIETVELGLKGSKT